MSAEPRPADPPGPAPGRRPSSPPAPERAAAFFNAVRRHRCGIGNLDIREGTVPLTGDGLGHFFTQP
ncbi:MULTISPECIES: hypothetical protein [unclassified Streptomyces]|uniref:hypothetical protein n=1 Tax=unclassified Streptomyces TaxID=2593676 RepID=UPI0037B7DD3F